MAQPSVSNQKGILRIPGMALSEEIGRGAESVVFRATRDGREFAVKIHHAEKDEASLRLRREAAFVARLRHPGLADILEVGEAEGRAYLVMEYVKGQTLGERLRSGPLDEASILALAKMIGGALGEVHRLGMVHRDVKPQNILMPAPDQAKLIDFGFAKQARTSDAENQGEEVVGTLLYSAPEQIGMLKRPVDGRADLYALGVVLFECATGAPPFGAQNLGELLRQHAAVVPPDVRESNYLISAPLAGMIAKLLAKDPDDRYQTARSLLADLENLNELNYAVTAGHELVLGRGDRQELSLYEVPLIGRERELDELKGIWRKVLQGRGGSLLVEGQPGTGKSRLVRELLDAARKDNALVLSGKASASDPLPFGPLRHAIEGYLRRIRRMPAQERQRAEEGLREAAGEYAPLLRRFSPRLAAILGGTQEGSTTDALETFYGVVAEFLHRLGGRVPAVVLFLDDVQWLDESSRYVLKNMLESVKESPFLVVATARNDSDSLPSLNRFATEMGPALLGRMATNPLGEDDVARLVRAHLGGGAMDRNFLRQLAMRTGGNPFSVGEYVRAMLDAGLLRPSWGRWLVDVEGLERLQLSDDAIQLVLKRLDGLEESVRQVLVLAALLGSKFPLAPLIALCGGQEQIVLAAIAQAVQEHLIERAEEGEYAFVHDRVQEALEARLTPEQKKSLHQMIAEVLDSGELEGPEQVMALARHYALGDISKNPKRVYEISLEAGLNALEECAPDEAYSSLQRAREAAGLVGIEPDVIFYQTLGEVCARTTRLEEAEKNFHIAIERTPERLRRASIRARLMAVLSANYEADRAWDQVMLGFSEAGYPWPKLRFLKPSAGVFYDIANWFAKLMGMILALFYFFWGLMIRWTGIGYGGARGRSRERYSVIAQLHQQAQRICSFRIDSASFVQMGLRGLFVANRLGASREAVYCYNHFANIVSIMSNTPFGSWRWLKRVAKFYFQRATRISEQLGDRGSLGLAKLNAGYSTTFGGDTVEGEALLAADLKEYGRWVHPDECQKVTIILSSITQPRGYFKEGVLWAERGVRVLGANTRDTESIGQCYTLFYTLGGLVMAGRTREALENLQKAEKTLAQYSNNRYVMGAFYSQKLFYFLHQEEFGPEMEEVVAGYDQLDLGTRPLYLVRLFHIYHPYVRLALCLKAPPGEREARIEALRIALEFLEFSYEPLFRAHAMVLTAALSWLDGNLKEANTLLKEAESLSLETDNPWAHFEALRMKGRILIEKGQNAGAMRLIRIAASLAAQYGWASLARQLQREFGVVAAASSGAITTSLSPTSLGPTSLSPTSLGPTSLGPTSLGAASFSPSFRSGDSRSKSSPSSASKTHAPKSSIHLQRQLDALLQVSLASASVLDPDIQARVVLDELVRILGAERAYLFLMEEGAERMVLKAGRDAEGNDLQDLVAYSSSIIERVLETREVVVFSGTEDGEVVASESVVAHKLRSIIAAPLLRKDQMVGVLYLDNRLARGLFTDDDVEILLGLGNHIAVALETAQLAKVEKERAELEKDMAVTATVQALLLPKKDSMSWRGLSLSGFYRPAAQSGGDWWWYEQRPDGKIWVLLGDVTGHGVGSAMVTAAIASNYFALRHLRGCSDPAVLIRSLSANFRELCGGSYMMTLSAIEIDTTRGRMQWWSAGAPPILVLKASGAIEALSAKGTPLGGSSFELGVKKYLLQPKDRVFMFSDGLPEAEMRNGRPFGLRRLQNLLLDTREQAADSAVQHIMGKFSETCDPDVPQEDDITFAIIDRA